MTTVAQLLAQSQPLLVGSDSPALDIELLLCHCLEKERSYLRAWPDATVPDLALQQFQTLLQRRIDGEPVAYLMGERGFWSLDLAVNASTLIPRPETELLVEVALGKVQEKPSATILDLGTGTGAIALSLAAERSDCAITACDIEAAAVALAESNRKKYALDNVELCQSDWFSALGQQRFDLIVSNPPYIDPDDIHLEQGDVRFEPRSALVAANKGLADIEHIISRAPAYLTEGAWLLFEHGYDQAAAVQSLLTEAGFTQIFTEQDLAGVDRVTGALGPWRSKTNG
ncbi:peptide chain release factor N(5)-glutamine methyltransferase [Oceanicoccus sagamiensis]|uniref:Release factor glutamine methyltransferase n=1 Tax=Oceanicoccus sagamiensis TaxID=716816 RepID=A0A1X9NL51_9GAMM|nr:peptide chain release factor N(5)-glutamine methyltransferase [Oceanicoccus sagamiensis]ARN74673.1 protein-(glutamine-N5) methyltransferase, release factor-specific [Oceanicoccus sagamiensis]